MENLRKTYIAGSWLFGVFSGFGHLFFELFAPRNPEAMQMIEAQKAFQISMPGTQTTLYTLTFGVSVILGLMLIGYGVMNLQVARETPKGALPSRTFQIINIVFALIAFILAWNYLFLIPTILTGAASVCFISVFVLARRYP